MRLSRFKVHHAQTVEPKLIATDVHHAGHTCRSIASEFATCLVSSDASAAATTAPAVAVRRVFEAVEQLTEHPGATAGASGEKKDATTAGEYQKGVAVFTIAKGGLMYEASVAGQKFSYKALQ